MLPVAIEERLQGHLREVRRQDERDLADGVGRVVLPFALDSKYPNAATDWAWQFVFPAARICRDPRWSPPSRFHLHESAVQREVANAVHRARVTAHVPVSNRFTPRQLRRLSAWPSFSVRCSRPQRTTQFAANPTRAFTIEISRSL